MWYNVRRMLRRTLALTLLAFALVQLVAPVAFASTCFESCADDADGSSCPPACATCAACPHSRQAIVLTDVDAVAFVRAVDAFPSPDLHETSAPVADIFHVPL